MSITSYMSQFVKNNECADLVGFDPIPISSRHASTSEESNHAS